jgi:hypothetical protein
MKKRRISLFGIIDHSDRKKVLEWLQTVHTKDIMDTGHFDKVLIFPSDNEPDFVTVISIAKSVEDCDQYETENLETIRNRFIVELVQPGRVKMLASYSCTEEAA